ncbi:hypothetical protein Gasu2_17150 [Galdieria sulphuraria]|nr:hypothetical protein Gasu2_17150 [Galdieria sulphuraria]
MQWVKDSCTFRFDSRARRLHHNYYTLHLYRAYFKSRTQEELSLSNSTRSCSRLIRAFRLQCLHLKVSVPWFWRTRRKKEDPDRRRY